MSSRPCRLSVPLRDGVAVSCVAAVALLIGAAGTLAQVSEAERKLTRASGSSCEVISADSLTSAATLATALGSRVTGFQIFPRGSRAGGGSSLRMRGNASVGGSNEPLVVIDDVPMFPVRTSPVDRRLSTEPAMNALDLVDPTEIEYVQILRGPAATTLYGMTAANGVIRIYTKRGSKKGGQEAHSSIRCPD